MSAIIFCMFQHYANPIIVKSVNELVSRRSYASFFWPQSLLKTQIACMDEDPQLCGSFLSSIDVRLSKCGPDALTHSCKWHKAIMKLKLSHFSTNHCMFLFNQRLIVIALIHATSFACRTKTMIFKRI